MPRAIRPYILVQTNPQSINKNQPLTISARLYDRDTNQPLAVRKIFLNIISMKDGHTIWPMEVVRKNDWMFDILIGTDNMKPGHTYQIRVSNNRNFSPMGATEFNIIKDGSIPLLLFPIPLPVREPIDNFVRRKIKRLIYRTQMDHRVCSFCKIYQNQIFLSTEEFPHLPIHINCRCTYDIMFEESFEASFTDIQQIRTAVNFIKKKNDILKAVEIIQTL